MNATVRHPEIEVQLSGEDGNVFSIIGRVTQALRRARDPETGERLVTNDEVDEFRREVMAAKSYDEALGVVMRWVDTV